MPTLSTSPITPAWFDYMMSGPVIAMVIKGGKRHPSNPPHHRAATQDEAAPGTIRGDFAITETRNIIHASDSAKTAAEEYIRFFGPKTTGPPEGNPIGAVRQGASVLHKSARLKTGRFVMSYPQNRAQCLCGSHTACRPRLFPADVVGQGRFLLLAVVCGTTRSKIKRTVLRFFQPEIVYFGFGRQLPHHLGGQLLAPQVALCPKAPQGRCE
jgi:hypothetical protein